jgi:alpha-L-fucosidase 2
MKSLLVLLTIAVSIFQCQAAEDGFDYVKEYAVGWNTLGTNENDSMPIGNGDIVANVWTEQNGDLLLLLAKADAWSEMGMLDKLGRLRVQLQPNPFTGTTNFTQVLELENASIELKSGANTLRVWVDANRPALHIQAHLEHPATFQVNLELWRKAHSLNGPTPEKGSLFEIGSDAMPVRFQADTVLPAGANRITWCHYNTNSIYPYVLRHEHLEALIDKYPDPLFHRCFGATLAGPGLVSVNDRILKSERPRRDFTLNVVVLTETNAASPQDWEAHLDGLVRRVDATSLKAAWRANQQWWRNFWNRSWIHVSGSPDAQKVSRGYAMQRYMIACSSRGAYPVKFNGGLFTVGHDLPDDVDSSDANHNPDYRRWGQCYWNQNNRLLYWPLLESGDFDLLKPWFDMYLNALPLEKARMWIYCHHHGASYPETMFFFGLPGLTDFGWNNPSDVIQSRWQRYHIQGALEVALQMLDYYEDTGDTNFARTAIVPFANAIVTYYYFHYPHFSSGEIQIAPAQSLETYQLTAINPTPDIAGLRAVIPRLLALPINVTSERQRKFWAKMFKELPPIPLGRTTAARKLPPLGKGSPKGLPTILPAEEYGQPRNEENPGLYVAFPYRLYGVGKPDLQLARTAYAARRFPQKTCWGQDGTESAVLGLTDQAKETVISEFTNYGDQRFRWFWRPAHDWIPDLDNGGDGMITLEEMAMQCNGKQIILLPAWPKDWTADFKLHAPFETTVEAHVRNGKIASLRVTPESRAKDVEVWNGTADKLTKPEFN